MGSGIVQKRMKEEYERGLADGQRIKEAEKAKARNEGWTLGIDQIQFMIARYKKEMRMVK